MHVVICLCSGTLGESLSFGLQFSVSFDSSITSPRPEDFKVVLDNLPVYSSIISTYLAS